MKAENSFALSFSIYDYQGEKHPRLIYLTIEPKPIKTKWIPQTLNDSIWVLYEFETKEKRDCALENLPPLFDKAHKIQGQWGGETTQFFYDHWCDGILSDPRVWFI